MKIELSYPTTIIEQVLKEMCSETLEIEAGQIVIRVYGKNYNEVVREIGQKFMAKLSLVQEKP